MNRLPLILLVACFCFCSCKVQKKDSHLSIKNFSITPDTAAVTGLIDSTPHSQKLRDSISQALPRSSPDVGIRIAAGLIYDNGDTGIIEDDGSALWNAAYGDGDSRPPSDKICIYIIADNDWEGLAIRTIVQDKMEKKIDRVDTITAEKQEVKFTVEGTGCSDLTIQVRHGDTLVTKTILMECGGD
jgi:hypothetical protein